MCENVKYFLCFNSTDLPPSSVIAIVALLHFALLHVLVGRHSEWVRRLNYIWRHKEMSSYQNAQDMITLRLGVADNTLPAHVLPHYSTPECVMVRCKYVLN